MLSPSEKLQLRPMTLQDIPFAMKLKSMAHWNQVESDWKLLLSTGSQGNFVALYEGKEAGTVTTLTYQNKFSWIGMVLVDPAYRGLGIGSALLKTAINYAKTKGSVRLDATPQGMKLYKTLGFQIERELLRIERKTASLVPDPGCKCASVDREVLKKILEIDLPVFGADRKIVLSYLFDNYPQYAFHLERDGKITGYCFGRSGSSFEHIGPIVAENQAQARDLLLTAIKFSQAKPLIVDICTEHHLWLDELKSLGFNIQRPFIRMYLGELQDSGKADVQYAIAGPELG